MGWASPGGWMEPMIEYADKNELWKDPHVLRMVELLVNEFVTNDWDNIYEFYESETFLRMMATSTKKFWQSEWKDYCDQVNGY
jgi:hypothetical protein